MSGMRAHIASRLRSSSLSAVPPLPQSSEYSGDLAKIAASVLYRSPLPSKEGRPVFILNAAALPDSHEADYDSLLPYVLSRLPEEDDLLKGFEYEVVFFAGDGDYSATSKKHRPGWGWFLQAYHVLSRAMRKRLQKLYIVHEKAWVRILTEIFSTIVSPKFRRKIYHLSSMTNLALQIPIENLLIPPSTYLTDRRVSDDIFAPYASGKRAFATRNPFPTSANGMTRFPRVLREATSFVLLEPNITSEGIFRIPPNSKLRDVLKEAYDRGQKYIVWKDNEVTLPIPPYPKAEHQDEIIAEVDPKDAYSVFMAAALIKAWYASLRQPIFPTESYVDLKRLYGDSQDIPDLARLKDLFSPTSEWSLLPGISREIVVRHLLPLLAKVASRQEQNKMTAENLAVCFAPALLCGPDQLEDAKMSSIIRRIFTQAVELWPQGLREACGQGEVDLERELKLPKDETDWEDPLEGKKPADGRDSLEEQVSGITMQDNEKVPAYADPPSDGEDLPPPLPPRAIQSTKSSADSTKRKPAPPLVVPPRYSTVISDAPEDVAESPLTYAATTDGFAPRNNTEQPPPLPPRWNAVADEKKSGTSNPVPISASARYRSNVQDDSHCPVSALASKLNVPKRKNLTPTQIDNAALAHNEASKVSGVPGLGPGHVQGFALPGLTNRYDSNTGAKRAPSSPSPQPTMRSVSTPLPRIESRRPSIPSPVNRNPSITSLARPVYPSLPPNPMNNRSVSKSTTLPIPASTPRLRAPSPSLLQRMPSFEKSQQQQEQEKKDNESCPVRRMLAPKKLNLKKQSVEDLRRLYEERAGTASALVEAGKHRYGVT